MCALFSQIGRIGTAVTYRQLFDNDPRSYISITRYTSRSIPVLNPVTEIVHPEKGGNTNCSTGSSVCARQH